MGMPARTIPIALGWVSHGILVWRTDRNKYFHEFNSSACIRSDCRLFTFDLLRGDVGAFRRAVRAGANGGDKEVWTIKRRDRGRLSFQHAGRRLLEPAAPCRCTKIF